MEKMDIDWCMGHKLRVDESYFQPDIESGIYLQMLECHDKKAGYLDAIDFLTIDKSNRLLRENQMLHKEKDQMKALWQEIIEINEKIGRPNPRDITSDIEFYRRMKNDELAIKTGRQLEQSAKEIREDPQLKAYMKERGYD